MFTTQTVSRPLAQFSDDILYRFEMRSDNCENEIDSFRSDHYTERRNSKTQLKLHPLKKISTSYEKEIHLTIRVL